VREAIGKQAYDGPGAIESEIPGEETEPLCDLRETPWVLPEVQFVPDLP